MKQQTVAPTTTKQEFDLEDLKQDFAQTKAVQVPKNREVRLVYKSCCGCGCNDVTILRTVPYESSLKDGDRIKKTIEGDKIADDY